MHDYHVRPLIREDVPYIVGYFSNLTAEDCSRMGIARDRLPTADQLTESLLRDLEDPAVHPTSFLLVWVLDGTPIGMNTIKDMKIGITGNMHLHMWQSDQRGQGHGARFFCMAALEFFERFSLRDIYCEPKSTNVAPNRMLQRTGFPLVKTYEGASSAISEVGVLNRYHIQREVCRAYLASTMITT